MTPHPLQPGAELDAEVAAAMGWTNVRDVGLVLRGTPPGGGATGYVPEFSSSMDGAWSVVEHMRKHRWNCHLIVYTNRIDCEFHRGNACFQESGESAAHVVCLAFLAAVASGRKERR